MSISSQDKSEGVGPARVSADADNNGRDARVLAPATQEKRKPPVRLMPEGYLPYCPCIGPDCRCPPSPRERELIAKAREARK